MAGRPTATSIDEYIAGFPPGTQAVLREMRDLIHQVVPEATETISYSMPTFDLRGKHLVHFAGYEHHIGLYPLPHAMETFENDLKRYKRGKGSVQFPLEEALPRDLIRRMVEFRVRETGDGGPE